MRAQRRLQAARNPARLPRARRYATWAAAVAMLAQALLPTYAIAGGALPSAGQPVRDAANLVAICTGNGVIWVALDEDGRPSDPKPAPAKPCHFCPCPATISVLPKSPPLDLRKWPLAAPSPHRGAGEPRQAVSRLPQPIRAPPVAL